MTVRQEIDEIWSILKTFSKGIEDLEKKLDQIIAFQSLQGQIQEMVEQRVEAEFKSLGLEKAKELDDDSRTVI